MRTDGLVKCGECGSRDLSYDTSRGETVCIGCGLVLVENEIDLGREWTNFGDQDKSRVGSPRNRLFHDKGLSTEIYHINKDYSGKNISTNKRIQFHRLRKWHKRAYMSKSHERNLVVAYVELDRIAGVLGLSRSVKEEAATIYRRAIESGLVRGRSIDSMVAACVYLVNQKMQLARSLDTIARATRCTKKEISKAHKIIKGTLKIRTEIPEPSLYVSRFCSQLELPTKVESRTYSILSSAKEKELTHGRSPMGIAAAAIYIAGRLEEETRTQREIANISDVTEVTIRNRYKELCHHLGIALE